MTKIEEKQAAHTAGPWEAHVGLDYVAVVPTDPKVTAVWVARVFGGEAAEANARLIAAAPDLLAALNRLVEVCEMQPRISKAFPEPNSPLGMARAAIAKATGGDQ